MVFLGTSGAQPTKSRNVSGIILKVANERVLLDCGDGIQRQMMKYGEGVFVDRILITHWHGDHYFGLFALLSTMQLNNRIRTLFVYGPKGLYAIAQYIQRLCRVTFQITYVLLKPNESIQFKGWSLTTYRGNHSIENLIYSFKIDEYHRLNISKLTADRITPGPHFKLLKQGKSVTFNGRALDPRDYLEAGVKGKKIVFSGDTRPVHLSEIYEDCGILVHECMYLDDADLPLAKLRRHTAYSELLELKKLYGISHVICTHFSTKCNKLPKNRKGLLFAHDGLVVNYSA